MTPRVKVGIRVYCTVCGKQKAPHGRSVAAEMYYVLCNYDCKGYFEAPLPGCLWPNETAAEFGYKCCDHATEEPIVEIDQQTNEK